MAGVLPSLSATSAITRATLRFASVFDRGAVSLFSEALASAVPAQVRKSLAVNLRPRSSAIID
jgi:hypothetical protein